MNIKEGELENLNKEQISAVKHQGGPMLVVAGAGTGKTRVIVERIQRLIKEGTPAIRILALTFTEKAAAEMTDRVNEILGAYMLDLPIMTFNAYGDQMLRRYGSDVGLGQSFVLMGESAQIVFMREHLDDLGLDYFAPISRPDSQLGNLRDFFSSLKQHVIVPEEFIKFANKLPGQNEADRLDKIKYQELASAYKSYVNLSRISNVIDYDDQIYLFIELLKRRANVLKEVQDAYDFIMVDEFQDTNPMQSTLVDMLAGKTENLLVVGDDDQSIYGFRGATLANILNFKIRYPASKEISLIRNYRSTQQILNTSYKLIQNNNPYRLEEQLKISKQLVSDKLGESPKVHVFQTLDEELAWVVSEIKKLIASGQVPGEIAVLARRNQTVELISEALNTEGIDHVVAGRRFNLYDAPVIKTLFEVLRAIVNPSDNLSLFHTLTGPIFNIAVSDLSMALAKAREEQVDLQAVLKENEENEKVKEALNKIKLWRDGSNIKTVGQITYQIIEESGYKDELYKQAQDNEQASSSVFALNELFKTMKDFEKIAGQPSAVQYLEALPALQAAGDSVEDGTLDLSNEKVNVLTIHKAKGLEWPTVYIVDCTEKSFPLQETIRGIKLPPGLIDKSSSQADDHIREERRLMYVAMTRAKSTLILTCSLRHNMSSGRSISRFITESTSSTDIVNHGTELVPTNLLKKFNTVKSLKLPSKLLNNNVLSLTVSQIDDYLRCPLNFYFKHVLNVPEPPNPARDYGTVIHELIEDINRALMNGTKIKLTDLQKKLRENWRGTGYSSSIQKKRAQEHALKTLKDMYERFTSLNEKPYKVEEPFAVQLKDLSLKIRGQFDALFPIDNGVEIRDYKTSLGIDTPSKAKTRASSSNQLTLYALAWEVMNNELPELVSLEFIETGIRGEIKKSKRGTESMKIKLHEIVRSIKSGEFPPGHRHEGCVHPDLN